MNDFDRAILEYRPRLRWRLELSGTLPPDVNELLGVKKFPSILTKAAELPIVGALDGIDELLHKMTLLITEISNCLLSKKIDPDIRDPNYLDYYASSINGNTQIEALEMLRVVEQEAIELRDFLIKEFFVDGVKNIQKYHETEAAEISKHITDYLSNPDSYDQHKISSRVILATVAYNNLISTNQYVDRIVEVLEGGILPNEKENLPVLVDSLMVAPDNVIAGLREVSLIMFTRAAAKTKSTHAKKKRNFNNRIQSQIRRSFIETAKLKETTATRVLSWAQGHDLMDEGTPLIMFLGDFIPVIDGVYDLYEEEALELFKINTLNNNYQAEIIDNLYDKKRFRQTYQLLHAIQEESTKATTSNRFIQKYQLHSQSGLCKDHMGKLIESPIVIDTEN